MIKKFSLAKGMFLTKISWAKGTVTSNHLPCRRREATRSYPTRWRPKPGEKGKRCISKFCLNNITQILCHIKDYNIWNSYSLTDMWLLPQN